MHPAVEALLLVIGLGLGTHATKQSLAPLGPALEELSDEYQGRVKIVKVNVDENPNSPAQLGVRGIPALFLFKDGEIVSNRAGAAPKAALKGWIDESL